MILPCVSVKDSLRAIFIVLGLLTMIIIASCGEAWPCCGGSGWWRDLSSKLIWNGLHPLRVLQRGWENRHWSCIANEVRTRMYVLERVLAQVSDILLHILQVAILHADARIQRLKEQVVSPQIWKWMIGWKIYQQTARGLSKASCLYWNSLRCWASQTIESSGCGWQVSSFGRCRNSRGVVSEGCLYATGYRYIRISGLNWPVHRVVMMAFHGLPEFQNSSLVHHRDGNGSNNRLDNLEWASHSQNAAYYYQALTQKVSRPSLCKPVAWRKLGAKKWETFASVSLAAERLGISPVLVSKCCRGLSSLSGSELQFEDVGRTPLDGEEWRPMLDPISFSEVPGRQVSSLGRITLRKGSAYKGSLNPVGYYVTKVFARSHFVHRLVALSFLGPPPPNRPYVNHKDLDKGNNAVENLEYVSMAENLKHFHANGVRREPSTGKPVWSRRAGSNGDWTWHPSMLSAGNALCVFSTAVSQCVQGRYKQTGGYEFRLAEPPEAATLPGEEWRMVDLDQLQLDRRMRMQKNIAFI